MVSDAAVTVPRWRRAAPMSPALVAWLEATCGGRVATIRRMQGGIATPVHRVTLVGATGARRAVVVRHWTGVDVAWDEVATEARVLEALGPTPVPAPALLAVCDGTDTGGVPALVMARLPGRVDLAPADRASWLHQMAGTLAEIHDVDVDVDEHRPRPPEGLTDPPPWGRNPRVWHAALEAVQGPPPETQGAFLHGDFQHFNLLWSRGRLTGVVDWAWPHRGAPSADVAHCLLNLTILFGADVARRFRLDYERASGRCVEPWWELRSLTRYGPGWQRFIPVQVAGQVPVDVEGMTGRVEDAMADALGRLDRG